MWAACIRLPLVFGAFTVVLFGLACSAPEPTVPPEALVGRTEWTTETASYLINLVIGSVVTMPMSQMTTEDQGQPVNHHLEVHIYDKGSGDLVLDVVPIVIIRDLATGNSRLIRSQPQSVFLLACVVSEHDVPVPHFGDNLYLPDSTYTFTVNVSNEAALSENVVVETAASAGM